MSLTNYSENAFLNAIFNNTPLQKSARYLQLHTGDPGENGTANVAVNTTRKALTNAAASGGVFTSVNDLDWLAVAADEVYTHGSIWDAPTGGNCLWVGEAESAQSVLAGDNFTVSAGEFTATLD